MEESNTTGGMHTKSGRLGWFTKRKIKLLSTRQRRMDAGWQNTQMSIMNFEEKFSFTMSSPALYS